MASKLITSVLLALSLVHTISAMTVEERRAYREKLLRILPEVEAFHHSHRMGHQQMTRCLSPEIRSEDGNLLLKDWKT